MENKRVRYLGAAICRRRFLAGGAALAAGAVLPLPAAAQQATIHELRGEVLINGRRATRTSRIASGDTLYTNRGAAIAFTLAGDAFFLREGSELRLEPRTARDTLVGALRLLSGALGATFARGVERRVVARTVTIGIRGTGVYVETAADETYACTCFGSTEMYSGDSGSMMERITVATGSHFARRIRRDAASGMRIVPAPFERHTNEEIARLEALAGRPDPFRR
jgi:hypothetical protein